MTLYELARMLDEAAKYLNVVSTPVDRSDAQWAAESRDIGLGIVEDVAARLREMALAADREVKP